MYTHQAITLGRPGRSVELAGLRVVEATYEPRRLLAPHAHSNANVSLVFEGGFEEWPGGGAPHAGPVYAGPGSLVLKPSGTVHSNRYGEHAVRALVIEITPAREAELGLARTRVRWFHGGPPVGRLLEVHRAFEQRASDLEQTTLTLLADVLRASRLEPTPRALGAKSSHLLRRAESLLRTPAERPLRSSELARRVGVHPVYLARLFRAAHGCGIAAFRRRLQVRAAAHRLAKSGGALSDVAVAAGFADQSHLSRAFRAELGLTPGEYRRLVTRAWG